MARETGLEPATSGVTGRRSNLLNYSRLYIDVHVNMFITDHSYCCQLPISKQKKNRMSQAASISRALV